MEEDKLITEMREQAKVISPQIMPQLTKIFGEYEVFSVEEQLYELIKDSDTGYNFKGFIDLVIQVHLMENFISSIGRHVLGVGMPKSVLINISHIS